MPTGLRIPIHVWQELSQQLEIGTVHCGEGAAAVPGEIAFSNAIPIFGTTKSKLFAKPFHVSQAVLLAVPEAAGDTRKPPFMPLAPWNEIHDCQCRRAMVMLHELVTKIVDKVLQANLVAVIETRLTESLTQPLHVANAILAALPKAVRSPEHPFLPLVFGIAGPKSRGHRAVMHDKKCTPAVVRKVLGRHPIPVFRTSAVKLLSQPIHIAPMVLGDMPEAPRGRYEQPVLPVVVRKTLFDAFNRGCMPVPDGQAGTMVTLHIVVRNAVEILHSSITQAMSQPEQIVAAVLQIFPEVFRDMAHDPHRIDPTHLVIRTDGLTAHCLFWPENLEDSNRRVFSGFAAVMHRPSMLLR